MGDTKRRTRRKVAVVRSVERAGERSQQGDRIAVGGTEEGCVFDKIESDQRMDTENASVVREAAASHERHGSRKGTGHGANALTPGV